MSKERLTAFTDAILAIIMTILVLELEKPATADWASFWELRAHFFSYAISFFWLGAMWVNLHNHWHRIEKIDNKVIWWSITMLFFTSFFPYVTDFVSDHFTSLFAQMLYSAVVICVSLSNMALARAVERANGSTSALDDNNRKIVAGDLSIKAIGIILAIFVYPPINMFAVILAGCEVTFLPHIVNRKNKKPSEIDTV